jgi:hypothetical protein
MQEIFERYEIFIYVITLKVIPGPIRGIQSTLTAKYTIYFINIIRSQTCQQIVYDTFVFS